MYNNLTPPVASSVLGGIALVLGACPFILFFYGEKIRKMSKVVQQLEKDEEEAREERRRAGLERMEKMKKKVEFEEKKPQA